MIDGQFKFFYIVYGLNSLKKRNGLVDISYFFLFYVITTSQLGKYLYS